MTTPLTRPSKKAHKKKRKGLEHDLSHLTSRPDMEDDKAPPLELARPPHHQLPPDRHEVEVLPLDTSPRSPANASTVQERSPVSVQHDAEAPLSAARRSTPRAPLLFFLGSYFFSNISGIIIILVAISAYAALTWMRGSLYHLFASLLFTPQLLSHLAIPWKSIGLASSLSPLLSVYCATIGVGCKENGEDIVGGVAR